MTTETAKNSSTANSQVWFSINMTTASPAKTRCSAMNQSRSLVRRVMVRLRGYAVARSRGGLVGSGIARLHYSKTQETRECLASLQDGGVEHPETAQPRDPATSLRDPILLQSPIQRCPAQPERLGDAGEVAVVVLQALDDHAALDLIEGHRAGIRERGVAALARFEIANGHEIVQGQLLPVAHDDGALDGLTKLADVARPVLGLEPLHRPRRNDVDVAVIDLRGHAEKVQRQPRDIGAAFTQRRELDCDQVQPIEQILTKLSAPDELVKG